MNLKKLIKMNAPMDRTVYGHETADIPKDGREDKGLTPEESIFPEIPRDPDKGDEPDAEVDRY